MPTLCITWWSRGLWKAIVEMFAQHDRDIIILARNEEAMKEIQNILWADKVSYYVCDIRDKARLTEVFEKINHIDCLINNSGIWYWGNTFEESLNHIEDTIQTNLIGAMRCTRLALPKMMARKSWVIIQIWSTQSVRHRVGASAYAASKAWLKMYTEALREEMQPYGISVLGIYPWAIETPMRDQEEMTNRKGTMMKPESVAKIIFDAYQSSQTGATQEDVFIRPSVGL